MKTLIVYYSRTGTTRKVADSLAEKLSASVEEIIDQRDRAGVKGYVLGGRDAFQERLTEIAPMDSTPSDYDLLIVGTPVWAGRMAPAVRTFLEKSKGQIKNLALFATQGAKPPAQDQVFVKMAELSGVSSKANLHLSTKQVMSGEFQAELDVFLGKISN